MPDAPQISTPRRFLPIVFTLVLTSACLFASAGRFDWRNAWVLLAINLAASVSSTLLYWRHPELLAERSNIKAGQSRDKGLVAVTVLFGPVATWVTAGLDTRFRWSAAMPDAAFFAGVLCGVLAAALIGWAMRVNRFFSAVVRIQKDRGHSVIAEGPYRFVRHPGYTGMAAFTLATPFILNSRWAIIPAVITAAVTALRTVLEDRTLHQELEGYAAYAGKVKYKLVPGVW